MLRDSGHEFFIIYFSLKICFFPLWLREPEIIIRRGRRGRGSED
jgi:hypothetical protein